MVIYYFRFLRPILIMISRELIIMRNWPTLLKFSLSPINPVTPSSEVIMNILHKFPSHKLVFYHAKFWSIKSTVNSRSLVLKIN